MCVCVTSNTGSRVLPGPRIICCELAENNRPPSETFKRVGIYVFGVDRLRRGMAALFFVKQRADSHGPTRKSPRRPIWIGVTCYPGFASRNPILHANQSHISCPRWPSRPDPRPEQLGDSQRFARLVALDQLLLVRCIRARVTCFGCSPWQIRQGVSSPPTAARPPPTP